MHGCIAQQAAVILILDNAHILWMQKFNCKTCLYKAFFLFCAFRCSFSSKVNAKNGNEIFVATKSVAV
jgi:hypothetical protein